MTAVSPALTSCVQLKDKLSRLREDLTTNKFFARTRTKQQLDDEGNALGLLLRKLHDLEQSLEACCGLRLGSDADKAAAMTRMDAARRGLLAAARDCGQSICVGKDVLSGVVAFARLQHVPDLVDAGPPRTGAGAAGPAPGSEWKTPAKASELRRPDGPSRIPRPLPAEDLRSSMEVGAGAAFASQRAAAMAKLQAKCDTAPSSASSGTQGRKDQATVVSGAQGPRSGAASTVLKVKQEQAAAAAVPGLKAQPAMAAGKKDVAAMPQKKDQTPRSSREQVAPGGGARAAAAVVAAAAAAAAAQGKAELAGRQGSVASAPRASHEQAAVPAPAAAGALPRATAVAAAAAVARDLVKKEQQGQDKFKVVPAAVPPPFSSSLTAVTAVAKQSTAGVQPDEGSDESSGETVGEAVAASSGVGRSMPKKQLTVQVQFGSEDGGQGLDGHQGRGSSLAWGDEDEGESAPERELRLAGKGDGVENADWFVPLRTRYGIASPTPTQDSTMCNLDSMGGGHAGAVCGNRGVTASAPWAEEGSDDAEVCSADRDTAADGNAAHDAAASCPVVRVRAMGQQQVEQEARPQSATVALVHEEAQEEAAPAGTEGAGYQEEGEASAVSSPDSASSTARGPGRAAYAAPSAASAVAALPSRPPHHPHHHHHARRDPELMATPVRHAPGNRYPAPPAAAAPAVPTALLVSLADSAAPTEPDTAQMPDARRRTSIGGPGSAWDDQLLVAKVGVRPDGLPPQHPHHAGAGGVGAKASLVQRQHSLASLEEARRQVASIKVAKEQQAALALLQRRHTHVLHQSVPNPHHQQQVTKQLSAAVAAALPAMEGLRLAGSGGGAPPAATGDGCPVIAEFDFEEEDLYHSSEGVPLRGRRGLLGAFGRIAAAVGTVASVAVVTVGAAFAAAAMNSGLDELDVQQGQGGARRRGGRGGRRSGSGRAAAGGLDLPAAPYLPAARAEPPADILMGRG